MPNSAPFRLNIPAKIIDVHSLIKCFHLHVQVQAQDSGNAGFSASSVSPTPSISPLSSSLAFLNIESMSFKFYLMYQKKHLLR